MVVNTLAQCGPELLQFLWSLADQHTQLNLGFSIETAHNLYTQQDCDYRRLRGLKYHENRLRLLTFIFEAVTSRIYGGNFQLNLHPCLPPLAERDPSQLAPLPTNHGSHIF